MVDVGVVMCGGGGGWVGGWSGGGEGTPVPWDSCLRKKSVPKKHFFIKRTPRNPNLGVEGVSESKKCIITKL